jgi:hypothetical protein
MPNTYKLVAYQTLGSDSTNINISLPTTGYTDIQIRCSLRSTRAAYSDGLIFYLNNDLTSSNYPRLSVYNEDGTTGGEYSSSAQIGGGLPGASNSSSIYGSTLIDLYSYRDSAKKLIGSYAVSLTPTSPNRRVWNSITQWENTNAISSIQLFAQNGNIVAGSTVSVYGITKA